MSFIFALKMALVPALIGAVTLAGRRWGATVAGWLSAFPIVSGPILYFIALDQGAAFVARAAVGTLSAVVPPCRSPSRSTTLNPWTVALPALIGERFGACANTTDGEAITTPTTSTRATKLIPRMDLPFQG